MSEGPADKTPEPQPDGVFGKLPASRPGTRSPRRDSGRKPKRKVSGQPRQATAKPAAASSQPRRPRPTAAREPEPEQTAEQAPAEGGGGLDDLAWAGVAAVAEAATLGVRLANRAMGALRDSVDRR